jgi:hypothetical protein
VSGCHEDLIRPTHIKRSAKQAEKLAIEPDPRLDIHLTPAVVMTAAEAAMWRHNPEVAAYLAAGSFDGEEIDLDAS